MAGFLESSTSMFEMCKQDGTSIDKCFIVACTFVTRGWCWHYVCGLNTRLSVNTERASDPLAWLQKLDFTFTIYFLGLNVCSSNSESCMLESCCILCTTPFPLLVFFFFWSCFFIFDSHPLMIILFQPFHCICLSPSFSALMSSSSGHFHSIFISALFHLCFAVLSFTLLVVFFFSIPLFPYGFSGPLFSSFHGHHMQKQFNNSLKIGEQFLPPHHEALVS